MDREVNAPSPLAGSSVGAGASQSAARGLQMGRLRPAAGERVVKATWPGCGERSGLGSRRLPLSLHGFNRKRMVAWAGSALHQEGPGARALACPLGLRGRARPTGTSRAACSWPCRTHGRQVQRALAVLRSHSWSPGVPLSAQPPQTGPDPSPLCRGLLSPGAWVPSAALTCSWLWTRCFLC